MKRVASWVMHVLAAIAIAGGIAGLHFAIWAWNNQAAEVIDSGGAINGFAFSGYRRYQNPMADSHPSEAELAADIELLSHTSRRIRTYSSDMNSAVPRLADDHGMRVLAGAWLAPDPIANERELAAALRAASENRNVDRLLIGNESLLRNDLTVAQLIAYLDRARAARVAPVSTAEPWHVWLKYPELAQHVDFITVHLLPYHEGVPVEAAVDYALQRYDEIARAFPRKRIVIGEVGWPSRGPVLRQAVPSTENQARFVREFLDRMHERPLDYYLMEAFDQPWKIELEGWAGAYWGMYDAERQPKFPLVGPVDGDPRWYDKAVLATALAFLPMLLVCLALRDWKLTGKLLLAGIIQACATGLVLGGSVPADYYVSSRDAVALVALVVAMLLTSAVLLTHGFEFAEVMFKRRWQRHYVRQAPLPADAEPFVSVHLACCNEPPEMVIATIDSLARLEYSNFEVLVIDNNTRDEALWKPVEAHMATLGPRFRFFHLPQWPGFKAGALNFALGQTDPRAEVIGVVDADYVVTRDWLASLAPHFADRKVAVVQAPQAHREWEHHWFRRMCNWEFDGFFRIGMHHRHERNALIQHGTMTLVRRSALAQVGGWSEWCICEDTELGLRLLERGYDLRYVDAVLGRGLTPSDFGALKAQRYRWAFGAMQILKGHIGQILGRGRLSLGQRYHFLTGWFSWFGDALQLVFALASIAWTLGMLALPKQFSLPVTQTLTPILGFLVLKAALGPILYRRTMHAGWGDILGASAASLGLSHSIARGVLNGLVRRKGVFVRTAKGGGASGGLARLLAPIREELALLVALALGAAAILSVRGTESSDVLLWAAVLALQALPYLAALACQVIAQLPAANRQQPAVNAVPAASLGRSRVAR